MDGGRRSEAPRIRVSRLGQMADGKQRSIGSEAFQTFLDPRAPVYA